MLKKKDFKCEPDKLQLKRLMDDRVKSKNHGKLRNRLKGWTPNESERDRYKLSNDVQA